MKPHRSPIVSPAEVGIENLDRVAEELGKSVVPIYNPTEGGLAQLVGTGFYLAVGDATFFVTAAHVGDWNDAGALHVSSAEGTLKALAEGTAGEALRTVVPDGKTRDDDRFDLAVIPIKSGWADPHFEHVLIGRTEPNDPRDPNSRYIVQGFPVTKNKVRPDTKRIKRRLFSYAAAPSDDAKHEEVQSDPAFFVTESAGAPSGALRPRFFSMVRLLP